MHVLYLQFPVDHPLMCYSSHFILYMGVLHSHMKGMDRLLATTLTFPNLVIVTIEMSTMQLSQTFPFIFKEYYFHLYCYANQNMHFLS